VLIVPWRRSDVIHSETLGRFRKTSDRSDMGAPKYVSSNKTEKLSSRSARSSKVKLDDYAPEVLVVAILLQLLYLAGLYSKTAQLMSMPALIGMLSCPTVIMIVASTWRRAIKFYLLSSLTIPCGGILFLSSVTIYAFVLKPSAAGVLKNVAQTAKSNFEVWGIMLLISIPAVAFGAIIRFVWSKLRPSRPH
jgi:hypothetical protein